MDCFGHVSFRFHPVTRLLGNAHLKRMVGNELTAANQKQSNANLPANLQDASLVRPGALRQHGAEPLRTTNRIDRERCSIATFKKVNPDVLFPFTFGHPNHRSLDRRQIGVWGKLNDVFRTQNAAGLKVLLVFILDDRNFDRRLRYVCFTLALSL